MSRIRIEQQVEVLMAAVKGHLAALEDAKRAGDTVRHDEVSERLKATYAEVRRQCQEHDLPLPEGIPDET